ELTTEARRHGESLKFVFLLPNSVPLSRTGGEVITRYVGVFCANGNCRHFIELSSHQTDNPNTFGTDLDPTSEKGITCPKCGLTCHYGHSDVAHSEFPDGSRPKFQN